MKRHECPICQCYHPVMRPWYQVPAFLLAMLTTTALVYLPDSEAALWVIQLGPWVHIGRANFLWAILSGACALNWGSHLNDYLPNPHHSEF